MFFISLMFILFVFFMTYRNINSFSTRFIYGLILGSVVSYIAFILYLSKFNFYYNIVSDFFNFSPGTWNYLVLRNFNVDTLIRILHGGNLLFYYSFLCFGISFANSKNDNNRRMLRWYILLLILPVLQFICFDPSVSKYLQNLAFSLNRIEWFQTFEKTTEIIFRITNIAYLLLGLFLLLRYFVVNYRIRFIRNYTFFTLLNMSLLASLFFIAFYWSPDHLIRVTYGDNFFNYKQPPLNLLFSELRIFPVLMMIALGLMAVNIFKYNSIENYYKNINIMTERRIDTASLGIRAFTHSIKNHLLAIRSETEYLLKKYEEDSDTTYSLRLILSSTNDSFASIDDAANKLNHLTLRLRPQVLSKPVEQALNRINFDNLNIEVGYTIADGLGEVLLDDKQMEEVVVNLLQNAVDAIGDKKDKYGRIEVQIRELDRWGIISITDNGSGIEEKDLHSIFSPFYSTKSSITNWGIGLSFCYKIIQGHDGKIEVNSSKGKGAQFNIFIPIFKKGE